MTASRAIRLVIAAGLFGLIVWYANPRQVAKALAGANWWWIGAAAALVLIDRTLMAWRWIALLAPIQHGTRPPVGTLLRIFFITTFIGTFIPSVGGDAIRAWRLSRAGVTAGESFASVLMDRLLGVVGILLAAAMGLMLAPDLLGERTVLLALAAALAGSAAGLAVVFTNAGAALRRYHAFDRLLGALHAYRGHHGMLAGVLTASFAVQIIRVVQGWLLGIALGLTAGFPAYLAFIPIILLVLLVPLPGGGMWSGNAAFILLFTRVGVDRADALALGVLFIGLGIVGNLPGAFMYATSPEDRPHVVQA